MSSCKKTISEKYEKLYEKITELLQGKDHITVGIDGGCTAGKSTLAEEIKKRWDCNVFHMDDFFLRPEQRTDERLTEVGGNVDRERFYEEVLVPLIKGEDFSYRPYDCKTLSLKSSVDVAAKKLNIVEGSYSLHPALASAYDLSVFLEISPELQRQRILQRDKSLHKRFFEEWIPMENKYFLETGLPGRCDFVI